MKKKKWSKKLKDETIATIVFQHLLKKYVLFIVSVGLIFSGMVSCEVQPENSEEVYRQLEEGFKNPPVSAQPKNYWWWMNGYTDSATMVKELEDMKAAGIGGLDLFEIGAGSWYNDGVIPAGPAFLSEESLQDIKIAVNKATELGLEVGFNTASSWNAGGSWIPPKYAAKSLYFSEIKVNGSKAINQTLPFPDILEQAKRWGDNIEFGDNGKPVFYEEVAVLAFPAGEQESLDTSDIKVLSSRFDPERETLSWNVPEGEWIVTRYLVSNSGEPVKLPSPNSVGPIIDHYDPDATAFHFNYIAEKLQSVLGDINETAIKYFYLASYEAKGLTWTVTLPEMFEEHHGYELYKFLPVVFGKQINSEEFTYAFTYDYNHTISELMINNHYRKGREVCKKYGLNLASEAGGPGLPLHNVPVDALKALGALDQPRGEFWKRDEVHLDEDGVDIMWLVKEIAAASHIYQRKIVEEEAFTSLYQWQYGPKDLKALADRAFCEGMNRVVVHGASHSPDEFGYPGIVYFAGTHYNNKRAWYPMVRAFNDYMARISWILQETDFQADVLYYYGDRAPNYIRPKNTVFTAGDGYDYEVINTEVLLRDLYVEDGLLKLPYGVSFKVLALSDEETINPEVLKKLRELAAQGAVIIGPKPNGAPGLNKDDIAAEIENTWQVAGASKPEYGNGKIWSGVTPQQALQHLEVKPVFTYNGIENMPLDFIHYAKSGTDFFLLRNTTGEKTVKTCSFRVADKAAEIWDPVTGKIIPLNSFKQNEDHIELALAFEPEQSCFVVFRRKNSNASKANEELKVNQLSNGKLIASGSGEKLIDLSENWQVRFDEEWGGPANASFPELISWTERDEEGIKYYSGIGSYEKEFSFNNDEVEENKHVFLELEEIEKTAKVWVNDKEVGILWSKPYRLDISEFLNDGTNQLRIDVANVWSNRLTGDEITGENYTNTNITGGPRVNKNPWAKVPLVRSGLIGKVELISYKKFN